MSLLASYNFIFEFRMNKLILFLIILSCPLFSQNWIFHTRYNSFLKYGQILDVVVDYNNNVWILDAYEVVFRLKDNNWIRYDKENTGFKTFEFSCIELLEDNSLMFGHMKEHANPDILIFKDENWTEFKSPDWFFNYCGTKDILYINENNIWFVTYLGVFHKDYNNWTHYINDQNYGHDLKTVHRLNNDIFVFSRFGTTHKYVYDNQQKNFYFKRIDQDFPKNVGDGPYFCNKKEDHIYANSKNGKVLMKFNGKEWTEESFNLQDTVKSIYLTREDKVIAITRNSVYEYQNNISEKLFDIPDSIYPLIKSNSIALKEIDYDDNYYFFVSNDSGLLVYTSKPTSVEPKTEVPTIFPNPTRDIINLNISEPTHIELYDILGNKLFKKFSTRLDLSDLSPGVYYIKYSGQTKMVVKE